MISLSNYNKISGNEYELDIGPLLDDSFLDNFNSSNFNECKESIQKIKDFFKINPDQEQRLISSNKKYLNIALRPKNDLNMSLVVPEIKELAENCPTMYDYLERNIHG